MSAASIAPRHAPPALYGATWLDTLAACRTSGRELGIRHGKAGTFAKGNYLHHFQRIVDELWLDAGPSGEPDQAFLETLRTA